MTHKNPVSTPIGAHMSIQGGLYKALLDGFAIGCTAIQLFVHSNRQWHMPTLSDEDIALFHEAQKQTEIDRMVAHASYLLNIGSPIKSVRDKSRKTIIEELRRCELLGIESLIIHPGAALESDRIEALRHVADEAAEALAQAPGKTKLLFETMAGQGTTLGTTFEELALILERCGNKMRTGICVDTCHIFAAGYDFSTKDRYNEIINSLDATIGLERIGAFHVNDSHKKCGSRVDRHADIGSGEIGRAPFGFIVNDQRLWDIPKILETPKGDSKDHLESDRKNLNVLRSLLKD